MIIRKLVATLGLLALAALPLAAPAATEAPGANTAPAQYTLPTRLVDRYGVGEYDGTLSLTVYPSGIVQGYYRPDDGGYRTVTGGVDGKTIWLDIGSGFRPLHVSGTFQNGKLRTVAALPGADIYTFESR
jgi:hypothetical protein